MGAMHYGFIYFGEQAVDGFRTCANLTECDSTTRALAITLKAVRGGVGIEVLREALPSARLILVFEPEDAPQMDKLLELGFDEYVCGHAHLARHGYLVADELNSREVLDVHRTTYHALRGFIDRIAARPDLQHVLRTAVLGISELFGIERVSVVLIRAGESFGHVIVSSWHTLASTFCTPLKVVETCSVTLSSCLEAVARACELNACVLATSSGVVFALTRTNTVRSSTVEAHALETFVAVTWARTTSTS